MTQAERFLSAAASRLPDNIRLVDDRISRALLTDAAKFSHVLGVRERQFVFEDGSRLIADRNGECIFAGVQV